MDRIAGKVDADAEPITMSTPCDLVIRDSCGMNAGTPRRGARAPTSGS